MEACQIDTIGLDKIGGMGLIAAASLVRNYAPLTGLEPELRSDQPAWVIQFTGEVPQLLARETWIDPICVVIGGSPGFYATGPVRLETGAVITPLPVPVRPRFSLPPLAP